MPRDFQTLRNLLYYPNYPDRLFFFNTLTFQTGYDNDEYINEAFHIASIGYRHLTKNILTNPQGLLTKGSQKYTAKITAIQKFLENAIQTEQKNESLYFRNMILTLQNKFHNLPMPESVQKLITYFQSMEKNGVFDYNEYIYHVNELLQGQTAAQTTINYEADRLNKLDTAYEQSKQQVAEWLVGGESNFSQMSQRAQNILKWRVGNELNARYMKTGRISNQDNPLPYVDNIINKIMQNVPRTADNKIAEFTSKLTEQLFSKTSLREKIIQKINQYYNTTGPIINLEQMIREEIILSMQNWGKTHVNDLLNGIAEAPQIAKIEAEIIADLTNLQGLYQFEIDNLPPELSISKGLAFFNNAKITKTGQRSGEKLYQVVKQFSNEIKNLKTAQLTPEQKVIANTLQLRGKGNSNSANKQILQRIERLQTLQQWILEQAKALKSDEDKLTLQMQDIINVLQATNKNSLSGEIQIKISKNGKIQLDDKQKLLTKILKENNYINSSLSSQTLSNFISAMKAKASRMFKSTLEQRVIKLGDQQLLDIFYRHLNTIKVNVNGATRNELMAGIQLIQKANGELDLYFGGTQNNKNDFVVITVDPGARELQQSFSIAYKDLFQQQYSGNLQDLYQEKIQAVKTFQDNFVADLQQMKGQHLYHDYQEKAKAFFKRYDEHTQYLKNILQQYEKAGNELAVIRKDAATQAQKQDKTDKEIKRILHGLKKSLTETIYRSDTMKTYDQYNNKIGFLGGSLGTGLEDQLGTINNLFAEAGMALNPQQLDYLTDLIINTSYESIIGTKYQGVIERYLSAVAAFALFDEGGAEIEILQKTIKRQTSSPKILHMYRLDGLYYPGSYILKETLAGVMELGKVMTITTHGARIKIVNPTNLNIVPNNPWNPGQPVDEYPWETVSTYALQHTQLQITFMAGMLQVLTNLQKRMNDIVIPA